MVGGIWRWVWTASVFGVFFVVVAAALDGAPPRGGALPVIGAGSEPIKERLELPPVEDVVPRSSVLNLLAEGDDPEAHAATARASLERGAEAATARREQVASLQEAIDAVRPGDEPIRRTAPAVGTGSFRIQIAAVRPGEEHDAFDRLKQRYAAVLGDLSPRFQVFSSENGVLVRVQAGPIDAESEAETRCRRLKEAGGDCFVVQAPG